MKLNRIFGALAIAGVLLSACAPAAAPAAQGAAAAGLPDLKGREVVIAVENAYNPFNFIDEKSGQAQGIDYDFFNEACKRMNCKTKFVTTSWDAIVAVMGGTGKAEWDVAADGITITPERAKSVAFSDPYVNVAQRLIVRKGENRFKTAAEFKANAELKFGAQPGTTNYDIMEKLVGKDRIVTYDQFGLIIEALKNKDIDASVMDDVAGSGYVQANADTIELLAEKLTGEDLGFCYPKGSDLREPFNAALKAMKADGAWEKILAKWLPGVK